AGGDPANRVARLIGNDNVALSIDGDAPGKREAGRRAHAIYAAAETGQSGERAHETVRRDRADSVVGGVGDIDRACRIDGDSRRVRESRNGTGAIRAAGVSRESVEVGYPAVLRNLSNRVIAAVRDVDRTVSCDRDAARIVELRLCADAIRTAKASPGNRADVSAGGNLADPASESVNDVDRAYGIYGNALWIAESRRGAHAVFAAAAESGNGCPSQRGDHALRS